MTDLKTRLTSHPWTTNRRNHHNASLRSPSIRMPPARNAAQPEHSISATSSCAPNVTPRKDRVVLSSGKTICGKGTKSWNEKVGRIALTLLAVTPLSRKRAADGDFNQ